MTPYQNFLTCIISNEDVGFTKEVMYEIVVLLKVSSHVWIEL